MKARVVFNSPAGTHFPIRLESFLNFVEIGLLLPDKRPPNFDLYSNAMEGLGNAPDIGNPFSQELTTPELQTRRRLSTIGSRFVVNVRTKNTPSETTDMWQSVLDSLGATYKKSHKIKDPFLVRLREGSWALLHPNQFKKSFVHSGNDPYWFFSTQNVPEFSFLHSGGISEQFLKVTLMRWGLRDKRNNT